MTVRVYRSTDAAAPVLSQNVGTLINVLDACLVNGYGAQASSGWTKPFTGTNLAAYRQPSGNQMYFAVNDTTTVTSVVAGYETMSAVTTGTNRFPTVAQLATGPWIYKSGVGAGIAVPWVMIATQTHFYLWINVNNTALPGTSDGVMYSFGDITSYKTSDAFATLITASYSTNSVSYCQFGVQSPALGNFLTAHCLARSHTQLGTSATAGRFTDYVAGSGAGYMGYTGSVASRPYFPEPVAGQILISPVWINEAAISAVRGVAPGVWNLSHWSYQTMPMSNTAQGPKLTFTQGPLSGKTIEGFQVYQSMMWIETSNTW